LLKRRLGRTELMVSVIGFGGLIIPRISYEEAIKVVRHALDLGVNLIDTAKSYGDSEEKVGAAISGRSEDCIITSKSLADNIDDLLADIDLGLKRLNTSKIELYQLHNISTSEKLEKTLMPNGLLDGLKMAKKGKKIDFIGFSGHNKGILTEAIKTNEFDFVEMPINVVDRNVWCGVLPLALERDMGVVAMKPLAGGALTDMSSEIISFALRYAVQQDISSALVGMKSIEEVEFNLRAGITNPYRNMRKGCCLMRQTPLARRSVASVNIACHAIRDWIYRQYLYCTSIIHVLAHMNCQDSVILRSK